ncbi:hypothetical protein BLGI_4002 [Brevibacillus laterosporus GI-9]|nr:hypothetical protein BLGI_4002 [Brevibacillus laterosporus GI-9]
MQASLSFYLFFLVYVKKRKTGENKLLLYLVKIRNALFSARHNTKKAIFLKWKMARFC